MSVFVLDILAGACTVLLYLCHLKARLNSFLTPLSSNSPFCSFWAAATAALPVKRGEFYSYLIVYPIFLTIVAFYLFIFCHNAYNLMSFRLF